MLKPILTKLLQYGALLLLGLVAFINFLLSYYQTAIIDGYEVLGILYMVTVSVILFYGVTTLYNKVKDFIAGLNINKHDQ